VNRVTPVLPRHPGTQNDSHCNSSSTETRVRVAFIGHSSIFPVAGTYYHWRLVTRLPPLLYPQEKREHADFSLGKEFA
ncbi:hypothetical protein AVEN_119152-1, partial [Araneus ventricosus]